MKVCTLKSTGALIESQSGDHAEYGTLITNAVNAGYAEEDIDERVVSSQEFHALFDAAVKAAETYVDRRRREYPHIGDQLDALYHAGVFPDEMAAKLKAVKDANPKD